ncbi:alpha/beta fold hydrolase [Nocardioides sp. CN2-186]|uniref:alpha/beta hydrolase family protein n=1 Tax=Nocardioides tweenelious TaxID=3156607 RepID=UPI0032B49089
MARSPGVRRTGIIALALLVVGVVACAGPTSDSDTSPEPSGAPPGGKVVEVEYAPGLTEELYLPARQGRVPLVVMVPGGGWATADPTGFGGLASDLAARGVAAAPTHIRSAEDEVVYPTPVEDILCATAAAVAELRARGRVARPVAVLGHSSGAQLAALAVLAPGDFSPTCDAPSVETEALVGLSGPYDISQVPDLAATLIGSTPDEDAATWEAANPVLRAAERPEVPVLLLHGDADAVMPVSFTTQFAEALKDEGHPTTVDIVDGADHDTIYTAANAGERVAQWLAGLTAAP